MNIIELLEKEFNKMENKEYCVYVVQFEDGMIKIGMSSNPKARIKAIARQSGRTVKKVSYTYSMPKSLASTIEHIAHIRMHKYHHQGEYFTYGYLKACRHITKELKRKELQHV